MVQEDSCPIGSGDFWVPWARVQECHCHCWGKATAPPARKQDVVRRLVALWWWVDKLNTTSYTRISCQRYMYVNVCWLWLWDEVVVVMHHKLHNATCDWFQVLTIHFIFLALLACCYEYLFIALGLGLLFMVSNLPLGFSSWTDSRVQ